MKICPSCKCDYIIDTVTKCSDCHEILIPHPTSEEGPLSIKTLIDYYHKDFPSIFYPYDGFYDNWDVSKIRLTKMLQAVLAWLKCEQPIECDYVNNIKEAGHYICSNGYHAIEINTTFANDPFKIAAILAHECLHYYMNKNDLEEDNFKVNELKTDLSTIASGLGLLVINGIQYRYGGISCEKDVRVAILNTMDDSRERITSVGYFTPEQYCEYFSYYLKFKGFSRADLIGYLHPEARAFLPRTLRSNKIGRKLKIIEEKEKYWYRNKIIHTILSIIAAMIFIWYYFFRR